MVRDFLKGFLMLVKRPGVAWGFEERRRLVRVRCHYRCVFDRDGTRYPATVNDLGEGGIRITSDEPLAKGQQLTLFCPFVDVEGSCGPVQAEVCWVRAAGPEACTAGVRYLSSANLQDSWVSWVLHLLGFPGLVPPSKRNWARVECSVPGQLDAQPVEVLNLGLGGALVTGLQEQPATPVQLELGPWQKLPQLLLPVRSLHPEGGGLGGAPGLSPSTPTWGTVRCEFSELSPDQLKQLSLYLKLLLSRV